MSLVTFYRVYLDIVLLHAKNRYVFCTQSLNYFKNSRLYDYFILKILITTQHTKSTKRRITAVITGQRLENKSNYQFLTYYDSKNSHHICLAKENATVMFGPLQNSPKKHDFKKCTILLFIQ